MQEKNQCTGAPGYQGEQDQDPSFPTDCSDARFQALVVRAAELEVFSR
jgi:extracellular elastinolytic metalloproteinase